jgi:protease I
MGLSGKKVMILVERDYQDLEVWYPLLRLTEEGAEVLVVGSGSSASYVGKYGYPIDAGAAAGEVNADDFDAVVVPGGWAPDYLRRYPAVVRLVREAFDRGKVIASICHGGSLLVSSGIVKGKRLTSFMAIKDDLVAAGAEYVDEEVVRDGNLITSRKPGDLPAFCKEIIAALS